MSSDYFEFKNGSYQLCELANLTMEEVMNGPYIIRFVSKDFGQVYFCGLDDDLMRYMNDTGRLSFTIATLLTSVFILSEYNNQPMSLPEVYKMKFSEFHKLFDLLRRSCPQKITYPKQEQVKNEQVKSHVSEAVVKSEMGSEARSFNDLLS